ncbi:MAG TPA: flagellar export chaperone FliS [Acidobacteria bacterium]|nr:flagellar export chaperone FliS [Acidobacteriota bacterium]
MNQALLTQKARHAYQATQIEADDPLGLVVRLYDGMIGFLNRGADALAGGDHSRAAEPIRRATDIVGELQAVLNLDAGGEVAFNLDRIYSYCRRQIMQAHLDSDPGALREVAELLLPLRDAWAEAREKQASEALATAP